MKHEVNFGNTPGEGAERDAVHVAVVPGTAAHILNPGEHVGFAEGAADKFARTADTVGIVDPFLRKMVMPGERFWLFLYPGTVTGMRHQWEHPAFPMTAPAATPPGGKAASEKWLRDFMDREGLQNYEGMIAVASGQTSSAGEYGEGWSGGYDCLVTVGYEGNRSGIPSEFWDHVEVVTGRKIPRGGRASSFSCTC